MQQLIIFFQYDFFLPCKWLSLALCGVDKLNQLRPQSIHILPSFTVHVSVKALVRKLTFIYLTGFK